MKLTYKGDYALKIVLDLSLAAGNRLVQMKDIAKRQDIPLKFLEQIVLLLKRAGYIRTVRGSKGGIALARDPQTITLGEIIRLIEGSTSPIDCTNSANQEPCGFENRCPFREVFSEVQKRIDEVVDGTSFAAMAERARAMKDKRTIDFSI